MSSFFIIKIILNWAVLSLIILSYYLFFFLLRSTQLKYIDVLSLTLNYLIICKHLLRLFWIMPLILRLNLWAIRYIFYQLIEKFTIILFWLREDILEIVCLLLYVLKVDLIGLLIFIVIIWEIHIASWGLRFAVHANKGFHFVQLGSAHRYVEIIWLSYFVVLLDNVQFF